MRALLLAAAFCTLGASALLKPSDVTPEMRKWHKPMPIDDEDKSYLRTKNVKVKPLDNVFGVKEKIRQKLEQQTPKEFKYSTAQFDGECGIENKPERSDKVVNGMEAEPHQFPWLGKLFCRTPGWSCTGSFISPNWFLTAGHCVDGCEVFEIHGGTHDLNNEDEHAVAIFATEYVLHEGYDINPTSAVRDIAVIPLDEPVPLDDYLRLACLPTRDLEMATFEGQLTTVTGWGITADGAMFASPVLNYAPDRPIISNEDCAAVYGELIHEDNICIDTTYNAGPEGGIGVCSGDSGGPLNLQPTNPNSNQYIQVGVASFVSDYGCENLDPHGFARVTFFLDWIEEKTGIVIQ